MKLDDYMTVKQAADDCGLEYKTLLKRIKVGTVPATRIGSKILMIKKTDVDAIKRSAGKGAAQ